jgi:predicted O-methyltransferase YrrM
MLSSLLPQARRHAVQQLTQVVSRSGWSSKALSVRKVGTWKDALRRYADAAAAAALPGGWSVASILAKVDGYLYPHEAVFLYWLARSAPGTGWIVEIGSFRGRSTLCLATGARERPQARVLAVDPHVYKTEAELLENIEHFGMADIVDPIGLPSVEAARDWPGRVRVLFVDGHHAKTSVEADIDAWLPHLELGGFVLLHDSTEISGFPGPTEVARTRLRRGSVFEVVGQIGSITWGKLCGGTDRWLPPTHGKAILDRSIRFVKGGRTKGAGG